jgi:hypothetical protein
MNIAKIAASTGRPVLAEQRSSLATSDPQDAAAPTQPACLFTAKRYSS